MLRTDIIKVATQRFSIYNRLIIIVSNSYNAYNRKNSRRLKLKVSLLKISVIKTRKKLNNDLTHPYVTVQEQYFVRIIWGL
jgi:hypothetical protein